MANMLGTTLPLTGTLPPTIQPTGTLPPIVPPTTLPPLTQTRTAPVRTTAVPANASSRVRAPFLDRRNLASLQGLTFPQPNVSRATGLSALQGTAVPPKVRVLG